MLQQLPQPEPVPAIIARGCEFDTPLQIDSPDDIFREVPQELKDLNNWVTWKIELRKQKSANKPTKPPYNPASGRYASSNDPSTWTSFEQAVSAMSGYEGIGFMLSGTPFAGVDFDGCVKDGEVESYVLEILKMLGNPYCEYSPSGTGLHVFIKCDPLPKESKIKFTDSSREKYGIEFYHGSATNRYLTITGKKHSGSNAIIEAKKIRFAHFLMSQILNERFKSLWLGDLSKYGNDHSAADLALMGMLARLLKYNTEKMETAFGYSVLGQRDKWLDRADYRESTIKKACEPAPGQQSEVHNPNQTQLEATPMPDPSAYDYPKQCLEGDLLADLTHELTDRTFLPPQFAYCDLQVFTGHALDGLVQPPQSTYLNFSTRFLHNKISLSPEVGKAEVWRRILAVCSEPFNDTDIVVPVVVDGADWGSGHYMVKKLQETPNCIAYLDEGKTMWLKGPSEVASLEGVWLQAFDSNEVKLGSLKNGEHFARNVHLSQTAGFTLDGFNQAFEGRSHAGSGYLSRIALTLGSRTPTGGKAWPSLQDTKAFELGHRLMNLIRGIEESRGMQLTIDPEAARLKAEFRAWLEKQDGHFASRLNYYFEKDCTLRTVFSGGNQTKDMVERSVRWGEEQLRLRQRLWPIDSLNVQGVLEAKILERFETPETIRDERQLKRALHISDRKGKYSAQQFLWAMRALVQAGTLRPVGRNRVGNTLYQKESE
jgi:hypothetical protein